jgi:hypothetical protein
MPPDEQGEAVEQFADIPLDRLLTSSRAPGSHVGTRPVPRPLRCRGGLPLTLPGDHREDRLCHLAKDMEGADLMRIGTPQRS